MFVLDASALISQFTADIHNAKMARWAGAANPPIILTDFAGIEFASGLMKWRRMRAIAPIDLAQAFSDFDVWRSARAQAYRTGVMDFEVAEKMVRDPRTKLRTMDALYVAVAQNEGATLVTFDEGQAVAARLLGVACVMPK